MEKMRKKQNNRYQAVPIGEAKGISGGRLWPFYDLKKILDSLEFLRGSNLSFNY